MDASNKQGGVDPGGARFGNFINYYQFNPAEERICHLPQDLFADLYPAGGHLNALDIGCNAGNLSLALHRRYNQDDIKLNILGVDIDEALIKRANDSLVNNDTNDKASAKDTKDKASAKDNTDKASAKDTKDKASAKDTIEKADIGVIEETNNDSDKSTNDNPANENVVDVNETNTEGETSDADVAAAGSIQFVHADVMSDEGINQVEDYLKSQDVQKFDMIFLFSVSMWIHLHHGDSGLSKLLQICSRISRYTLLEPQPWKCYQTAARRMRKLSLPEFPKFSEIKIRGENLYPGVLDLARSHKMEVLKEFGQTKWNRKLLLLKSVEK